jgi:hypothetical protein
MMIDFFKVKGAFSSHNFRGFSKPKGIFAKIIIIGSYFLLYAISFYSALVSESPNSETSAE